MNIYHAVVSEDVSHWHESISSASGAIDVAIVILPDGRLSALRLVRNGASEAELGLVLDAIRHAKIPPPPAALLQQGVFHMIMHLGRPRGPKQTMKLTATAVQFWRDFLSN